ncbi:MAG: helix-turn-helix domain-containing protein [Candidatus Omnitrophica bacterium]|nr:helix-turn-helix domain-containing protein [Candidatus Omnitrophota bacterium]
MTREDILTVEQISEILGISRNTIQRRLWRERTGCPLRKIGKRLYALAAEFYKWMKGGNG